MSNRLVDPLFQLIHSLEKAEKRHFKLYIKRNSAKEDLKIIQLFDAIAALPEYDERILLKKLSSIEKPQLANLKTHLYKQLLASLRLLKSNDSVDLQLHEQLDYALARGINFIDTADVYSDGESEKAIGRFLKTRKEKLFVATKCGRQIQPHVNEGYTPSVLRKYVEDSLKRLQIETLDLIQLHCPPTPVYYRPEIFETFQRPGFIYPRLITTVGSDKDSEFSRLEAERLNLECGFMYPEQAAVCQNALNSLNKSS